MTSCRSLATQAPSRPSSIQANSTMSVAITRKRTTGLLGRSGVAGSFSAARQWQFNWSCVRGSVDFTDGQHPQHRDVVDSPGLVD